jgi:peptidoglycan hydrolase-like protein with peptidoglycan-binding domain
MGQGAVGSHVQVLQNSLVWCHGLDTGGIDSNYGPKTRAAVIALQRSAGIPADGIYGPQTRAAMHWMHVTYGGGWYCGPAW